MQVNPCGVRAFSRFAVIVFGRRPQYIHGGRDGTVTKWRPARRNNKPCARRSVCKETSLPEPSRGLIPYGRSVLNTTHEHSAHRPSCETRGVITFSKSDESRRSHAGPVRFRCTDVQRHRRADMMLCAYRDISEIHKEKNTE